MRHVEEKCQYCGGTGHVTVVHFDDGWEEFAVRFVEEQEIDPTTEPGQRMVRRLAAVMRHVERGNLP